MVLSDIVFEYKTVREIVEGISLFVEQAQGILSMYSEEFKTSSIAYFTSTSGNPASSFISSISKGLETVDKAILHLNSQTRTLYKCIALLENLPITNKVLSHECTELVKSINVAIDKMYAIIETRVDGSKKKGLYSDFLDSLSVFLTHYNHILFLYKHVSYIDLALYEPLPTGISPEEINTIEIKSDKNCSELSVYSQDMQYLSRFIQQFEMIKCASSSNNIFTRKIENGSLKIVLGSKEIDLSCVGDIVSTIVSAIKNLAFLPSEIKYKNLENEAKEIENENARTDLTVKKLNIINSQIDTLIDKLGLNRKKPEDREKIQLLCIPLIDYLESNPVGSFNGVKYDLLQELYLIEDKDLES